MSSAADVIKYDAIISLPQIHTHTHKPTITGQAPSVMDQMSRAFNWVVEAVGFSPNRMFHIFSLAIATVKPRMWEMASWFSRSENNLIVYIHETQIDFALEFQRMSITVPTIELECAPNEFIFSNDSIDVLYLILSLYILIQ